MQAASDDDLAAKAAASLLGISPHTVEALVERGELVGEITVPTDRLRQRRRIRIERSAIDDFRNRARARPGDLRHLYPE